MKKILENWQRYLKEETDLMQSANKKIIILADWVKKHISEGHSELGKGSMFAKFDLSLINNSINEIKVEQDGGVYTVDIPGVGYDLVLPMNKAVTLPDAKKVVVEKEERGKSIKVIGITTSLPLEKFKTNKMSVVIRPTTDLQYVPDDIKEKVTPYVQKGLAYSVLSAWPGRSDVPPASQWEDNWAIIIPQK